MISGMYLFLAFSILISISEIVSGAGYGAAFDSLKFKLITTNARPEIVRDIKGLLKSAGARISKREGCATPDNLMLQYDVIVYIQSAVNGSALDNFQVVSNHVNCLSKAHYKKTVLVTPDAIALLGGDMYVKPFSLANLKRAYEQLLNRAAGFRFDPIALPSKAASKAAFLARPSSRVVIRDKLYLIGGLLVESAEVRRYIDVCDLSNDESGPRIVKSIPIPQDLPVLYQGVAGDGKRYIYVAGGQLDISLESVSNTVFRFDTLAEQYLTLPSLPSALRSGSLIYCSRFVAIHFTGGYDSGGFIDDGKRTPHHVLTFKGISTSNWESENSSWEWTNGKKIPRPRRVGHASVVLNDAFGVETFYIIGGSAYLDDNLVELKTVYKFEPLPRPHWKECVDLPIGLSNISLSVVHVAQNTGVLLFGGQTTPSVLSGSTRPSRHVIQYIPHLNYSRSIAFLPEKYRMNAQSIVIVQRIESSSSIGSNFSGVPIWCISEAAGGETQNNGLLARFTRYFSGSRGARIYQHAKISLRLFYSDFWLDSIGSPAPDDILVSSLNLKPGEKPVYMVLHTDGGITNLKMNIVAATEQARRNNLILVLPDMATDWVASRKNELASGQSVLVVNKCGYEDSECVPFGEIFDTNNFISEAKKLGITVVRNTLPFNSILRYPSEVLNEMEESVKYNAKVRNKVESALAVLAVQDHMCCHGRFGLCNLASAPLMGSAFVLSGVANYWHINFTSPAEKMRRDALFAALIPSRSIAKELSHVLKSMKSKYRTSIYDALHLRIEPEVQVHCNMTKYKDMVDCYVPKEEVMARLGTIIPDGSLLYVAIGNSPERDGAISLLRKKYTVISKEDLYPAIHNKLRRQRELLALVDQEICMNSQTFVGSRPSSFSFLVAALRTKKNLPWAYYNDKVFIPGQLQEHSKDFVRGPAEMFLSSYSRF